MPKTRFGSRGVMGSVDGFKQKKLKKTLIAHETPCPPFMAKAIKNFHFVFEPFPQWEQKKTSHYKYL